MQTAVTKRGQTIIPALLRKRHKIDEGTRLVWLDDGETIRVCPIPADSFCAVCVGVAAGNEGHDLRAARRAPAGSRHES